MNVLIIDGPAKGQLRDVNRHSFIVQVPNPETITIDTPAEEIYVDTFPYFVHPFRICGYVINIASTHMIVEDVDPENVFGYIISDMAKEAVER